MGINVSFIFVQCLRTFIGYDVCEYPDSGKINFMAHDEIFRKAQSGYFDGEENVRERWREIGNRSTR
ncbi:MAG: hypothetical protein LBR08_06380 [Bacteroidales bacterium]|jgi:hypothetical protein|nr:hypothetical protein [Bacteroidales bacterium]